MDLGLYMDLDCGVFSRDNRPVLPQRKCGDAAFIDVLPRHGRINSQYRHVYISRLYETMA